MSFQDAFNEVARAIKELDPPRPEIPVQMYIMMCLSLNKDPLANQISIIVGKDDGQPICRRTPLGPAIALFGEVSDILDFAVEELPKMGVTISDTNPIPLRICVDATDEEILDEVETVKGSFKLKSVTDTGDGYTYQVEPNPVQVNPFGPNVIGEA